MSLKVVVRRAGEITLVDLSGRITLGEGSVVLRNTITDLLAEGHRTIHLGLSEVTFIDSSGIGELVSALTRVQREGGELTLIPPDKIRDFFPF